MRVKQIGVVVASAATVTALAVGPAFAVDHTYGYTSGNHQASGGLIWLNRSVTVQGSVTDIGGAGTKVEFDAYAGATDVVDIESRSAVNEVDKPYHFTLDGSAVSGGITDVYVFIWNLHTGTIIYTKDVWR